MSSSIGKNIKVTLFGESHGSAVGCVIDGLPANMHIDFEHIEKRLAQRRPGQSALTTARTETDRFEIVSGVFNGKTSGTPLCVQFQNADRKPLDYDAVKRVYRPGHADFTGSMKYHGANDLRGGGHFSARLTAPLVFAGALAEHLLYQRGIKIASQILKIGKAESESIGGHAYYDEALELLDASPYNIDPRYYEALIHEVTLAKQEGDSVGAIVETAVFGMPVGLGAPFFDTVEGQLSYAMFGIPAMKGISFGDGFDFALKRGSDVVDAYIMDHQGQVKTNANHNGGINGGISNGMPLHFKCVFKPTASIGIAQQTLDFESQEMTELKIEGRHDPCVALRAVPIVKAVTALVILDMLIAEQGRDFI